MRVFFSPLFPFHAHLMRIGPAIQHACKTHLSNVRNYVTLCIQSCILSCIQSSPPDLVDDWKRLTDGVRYLGAEVSQSRGSITCDFGSITDKPYPATTFPQ